MKVLFFEPFLFENVPALNVPPSAVFLNEVENSDIYIGIFGKHYGFEDAEGVSPTEREFDFATCNRNVNNRNDNTGQTHQSLAKIQVDGKGNRTKKTLPVY